MQKTVKNQIIYTEKMSPSKLVGWITAGVSLLLIALGVVGLLLVQEPLQENQDLRQQASVAQGEVLLGTVPADNTTLTAGQPATVGLTLNTQGIQTDGIELTFHVIADSFDVMNVTILPASGLQTVTVDVEKVADGFLVHLLAVPQFGSTFSSTTPVRFAELTFTPTIASVIRLNFDPDESLSTVHNSNPPRDELRTIPQITFLTTTTPSSSPTATPTATPTITPTGSASPTATPTTNPTPVCGTGLQCASNPLTGSSACRQTASTNVTIYCCPSGQIIQNGRCVTSGVGGTTYRQCNESCSNNSDCAPNYRCYNDGSGSRCRLVTNVSSSTCSNPPDRGLQRTCNQYCADTRECASGYTCFYNRCRRPENPDSASCAVPSTSVQQAIVNGCRKTCSQNSECAANLRCYYGECRLATNPGSTRCLAATVPTVSGTYYVPSENGQTKGGLQSGGTSSASPSATTSASVRPSTTPATSIRPTTPSPTASAIPAGETQGSAFQGALSNAGRLVGTLARWALIIGGILLLLVVLALLFGRRRSGSSTSVSATKGTPAPKSKYEQDLQAKIQALRAQQAGKVPSNSVAPTTATPAATRPTSPPSEPPQVTVAPTAPRPTITPAEAPTAPATPSTASSTSAARSSMVERLRQKGVTPPQK